MSRWRAYRVALSTEGGKLRSSRVVQTTALMLTAGVALLCAAMTHAVASGDPVVVAKFGPVVAAGGWHGYLSGAAQVTAVASMLGFGVALAWTFGREFADGTVTGLFALPIGRRTLASAKLSAYAAWAAMVSVALMVVLVIVGFALGLGLPGADVGVQVVRQVGLALLTAALAVPAGWAATVGRGVLAGIGATVALVVAAAVAELGGVGAWFPFAAPGIWATSASTELFQPVSPVQLALVLPVAAAFGLLTVRSWDRLQLDR